MGLGTEQFELCFYGPFAECEDEGHNDAGDWDEREQAEGPVVAGFREYHTVEDGFNDCDDGCDGDDGEDEDEEEDWGGCCADIVRAGDVHGLLLSVFVSFIAADRIRLRFCAK